MLGVARLAGIMGAKQTSALIPLCHPLPITHVALDLAADPDLPGARIRRPFHLQPYRRDMGGGQFVLLKEAAAPIVVAGKHWGGLRVAFKF